MPTGPTPPVPSPRPPPGPSTLPRRNDTSLRPALRPSAASRLRRRSVASASEVSAVAVCLRVVSLLVWAALIAFPVPADPRDPARPYPQSDRTRENCLHSRIVHLGRGLPTHVGYRRESLRTPTETGDLPVSSRGRPKREHRKPRRRKSVRDRVRTLVVPWGRGDSCAVSYRDKGRVNGWAAEDPRRGWEWVPAGPRRGWDGLWQM